MERYNQFIAVVEHYLRGRAHNFGRYNNRSWTWFFGAGIDIFYQDNP